MAIRGTYLVLKVNTTTGTTADSTLITADSTILTADAAYGGSEDIIAESIDISVKLKSSVLDITSQDSGLSTSLMQGTTKIGMAGRHLYAIDGDNWDRLYEYYQNGTAFDLALYRNEIVLLSGSGILKKLSIAGASKKSLITGMFAIVVEQVNYYTADSTLITADTTLITADAA